MSKRLVDLGFQVTASDLVTENFRLADEIPFVTANFNDKFSSCFEGGFDALVAVEIIEHIENPRNLLAECWKLLAPGGTVIVSTPNVNSPVSKAVHVLLGHHAWFGPEDYESRGHLGPVSALQFEQCANELGFAYELETFGNPYDVIGNWWKMRLLAMVLKTVSRQSTSLDGAVLIAWLTKPSA